MLLSPSRGIGANELAFGKSAHIGILKRECGRTIPELRRGGGVIGLKSLHGEVVVGVDADICRYSHGRLGCTLAPVTSDFTQGPLGTSGWASQRITTSLTAEMVVLQTGEWNAPASGGLRRAQHKIRVPQGCTHITNSRLILNANVFNLYADILALPVHPRKTTCHVVGCCCSLQASQAHQMQSSFMHLRASRQLCW